jgi:hypothetical protein
MEYRGGARNQLSPGPNKLINAWLLASFHSLSISKFHVSLCCMRMTRAAAQAARGLGSAADGIEWSLSKVLVDGIY